MSILDKIDFGIKYVGRTVRDDNWQCDEWECTIEIDDQNYVIPYYMGIGHSGEEPEMEDVLDCLLSDARAGEMTFDEFCNEFGYDNDSIKILNAYKECKKTADKLSHLFSVEEREELEEEIWHLQNA